MATRRMSDTTPSPKPAAPVHSKSSSAPPQLAAPVAVAPPAQAAPTPAKPAPRKRTSEVKASAVPAITARARVSPDMRRAMIAEAAYLRAERRGFAPGHEAEDWLAAEVEVDTLLSAGATTASQ